MEFLREALGNRYEEFNQLIKEYNASVKESKNQIKLADLSSGDYVSKAKYTALKRKADKLMKQLDKLKKDSPVKKCSCNDLFDAKKTSLCGMEVTIRASYRAV